MKKSHLFFKQSEQYIPGGVNSGAQACVKLKVTPLVIDRGEGAELVDLDENRYIDYCCSWGALLHGHAHPHIVDAVKKRLEKGTTFGIPTAVEQEMARKLLELLPWNDKVRFFSSGTEATMTAARLARGYTGRSMIIKFDGHYHGHSDSFLVKSGSGVIGMQGEAASAGVPEAFTQHTLSIPFNDCEALKNLFFKRGQEVAGVILEPVAGNMGVVPATKEFLDLLRELTLQYGTVLIFDEVITGFRVGEKGAQGHYGIYADLTCLGKIVGGGFPAAAVMGKQTIMDLLPPLGNVYQAGTLSGNPVAMVAGKIALDLLSQKDFYIELQRKVDLFLAPIEQVIQKQHLPACLNRIGAMFTIFFGVTKVSTLPELSWDLYREYYLKMLEQGIYMSPSPYEACFVSMAHTDKQLIRTRDAIIKFLLKLPSDIMQNYDHKNYVSLGF